MKRLLFPLLVQACDALVTWVYGKDALLGFYIGRLTAVGLRQGVTRGQIHAAVDRVCVLLWENR